MADLLTHVLVPYILLTIASWQVDWLTKRWITIGMAGAAIPDLVKIGIVLDARVIESVFGMPFSYAPISSLGGVLLIVGGIAVFFRNRCRRAYGLLVFGGLTSLLLDGLRVFADGRAGFWVYPVWWRPPTPSLYVTSNPGVPVVALVVSMGVFLLDRYH